MKFAYFDTRADAGGTRDYAELIDDLREEVVLCDQAGFHAVWLGEHHMGPERMDLLPNPILLGADLAARTKRLRIGQAASLLPLWHPIRLAEDIAMLDHMTKGRVDVGIGRGIRPRDASNFHPHADPRNPDLNRELFEETLAIMKSAWTEPFFEHEGPNYRFPIPGLTWKHPLSPPDSRWMNGEEVTRLCLQPKPYQKPHPPLWIVADSERSVRFGAENGLNVMMWQPTAQRLRDLHQIYAEVRSETEGRAYRLGEGTAIMRNTYVAPTMKQARRDVEKGLIHVMKWTHAIRGLGVFMNPGEELEPELELDLDFLIERGQLIGTPESVTEQIHELHEVAGIDYVLTFMAIPWLPHSKVMQSIELFAAKVLPHFERASDATQSDLLRVESPTVV